MKKILIAILIGICLEFIGIFYLLETEPQFKKPQISQPQTVQSMPKIETQVHQSAPEGEMVWIPHWGTKYHNNKLCSGMKNPSAVTEKYALSKGYTPCENCY